MQRPHRTFATILPVALVLAVGCENANQDFDKRGRDDQTTVAPGAVTSTRPPQTSTTLAPPTSAVGGAPGQGQTPPAPGPTY